MSAIPSVNEIIEQEQRIRVSDFDFNAAWFIGGRIRERAISENLPIAIEVYAFGQILFLTALKGSSGEHLEWMARKRNTVLRNSRSSLLTGEQYKAEGRSMEDLPYIDARQYTDSGGSFPILMKSGAVIGAVTVSGLASHEDHDLAAWGIEKYLQYRDENSDRQ
ncbi:MULTISPECIES: heme-degrading domain-containing protein [unclassified Brenneria]|uniref:heme-degrading domain-containing protein n=1 Tax=unclassified Brenneria TaxID=2634434 RepID=UPI001551BBAB|nr:MULTISPECIES: heme-degrading domain-containing protein [unclassified Brenneria]MBJ7221029.1 heme-degrading domain-containing protein [Brenneria sp. L3-3C-1]MEE3642270.1 heme-degrading domain-containing protein [Brenneria sp. L3_3C_1]MEE3650358.1 heme-degrading domain-containing protein [Brenneria sp. HEZEL_4_2_4]NPD00314.1 heme-degrading domain-containing protein [Brenneria sp. hezel4-2-4]